MAILVNPPSYLTPAQFRALPTDYDLSSYTDAQLQSLLNAATGTANAIMRRNLLAEERTIRVVGDGTNRLELHKPPLYLKRVQIATPRDSGLYIPLDQILVDYTSGSIREYTPMLWNGLGYFARFPRDVPVDVTIGSGYGFNPYSAPSFTTQDSNGGLPAGTYNVAATTQTMFGETTASVKQVSTSLGAIVCTVNETLGAYLYRFYVSSAANNTTLNGATVAGATSFTLAAIHSIAVGDVLLIDSGANAEYLTVSAINGNVITTNAATYAHANGVAVIEQPKLVSVSNFTAYGSQAMTVTLSQLTPTQGLWQDVLPLSDTSAPQIPQAITEAVRLLVLMQIYENNNLANRGVNLEVSGAKRISWRSTEGNSGRGIPLYAEQAANWLKPYGLQAVF